MLCAAGVRCKLSGQTPGPPFCTVHVCRKCRGCLHGICGEKDTIEDDDCKRVCEGRAVYIAADSNKKAKQNDIRSFSIHIEFGVGQPTPCC